MKLTRNEFLKTLTLASAGLAGGSVNASAVIVNSDESMIKLNLIFFINYLN